MIQDSKRFDLKWICKKKKNPRELCFLFNFIKKGFIINTKYDGQN